MLRAKRSPRKGEGNAGWEQREQGRLTGKSPGWPPLSYSEDCLFAYSDVCFSALPKLRKKLTTGCFKMLSRNTC